MLKNRRKVLIAYLLLKNINDTYDDANRLVNIIKQRCKLNYLYHVNLIQYNKCSSKMLFETILKKNKIPFSIRKNFGKNINAACGQLGSKF